MAAVFWVSLGVLLYVFAGYPLILRAVVWLRGARPIRRGPALPSVTLVISAFNEVATIREKLRNSLALDYPVDCLDIVVVSDASTDGTDEAVREFGDRGVRLVRQARRLGKTSGLNGTVPQVRGEIVVFSDANALYERNAIRMLVRNFSDPDVGCVTGEARYLRGEMNVAEAGEMAYWDYEISIKRLETAVGSMVGGDGAIYAIRRSLWRTLPADAINDFLNPLQVVASGWRAVYEPEAVCYEETAGSTRREYHRRVRIVSRSWRAIFQEPRVLNPFRVGLFSVSVLSHKILRWLAGLFLMLTLTAPLGMNASLPPELAWLIVAATLGGAAVVVVVPAVRRIAGFGAYFLIISIASVVGILKGSTGRVSGTWTTVRASPQPAGTESRRPMNAARFAAGRFIAGGIWFALLALVVISLRFGSSAALAVLFWASSAVLAYVYIGYPVLVAALRPLWHQPVRRSPIEPRVCLLITANDEQGVIEAKLRNCLQLDYPADRFDIVVASDGSVDRTNEIVRAFDGQGVRLIAFPQRRGKIAAINEAMSSIDAEIVVFSDANTFLRPAALRALVRNFADPEVGAASGDVALVGERAALARSEDLYYRYERRLQQAESEIGSMIGVDGALYAIRRELFVPPPADTILDDMAIPMAVIRAGRRVVFEPEALAFERGSDTAVEEFARKSRVVAGAVQFLGRGDSSVPLRNVQVVLALTSHKALRWLSPAFAIAAFVAALSLGPGSTLFGAVAAAQALSVVVAALGCFKRVRRWNPIGFAHYFWLVQTAAAVGFVRGLRGRQAVAWRRFRRAPMEIT